MGVDHRRGCVVDREVGEFGGCGNAQPGDGTEQKGKTAEHMHGRKEALEGALIEPARVFI